MLAIHRDSNSCICRSATSVFSASVKRLQVGQRWIVQMFDWMSCDFIRIACSFLHSRHRPLCLKCLHNLRPFVSTTRLWKEHEGHLPSSFPSHNLPAVVVQDLPKRHALSSCPFCVDCVPRTHAAYSRFKCVGQSRKEQSVLKLNRKRIPRKSASCRVPHWWNLTQPTHSELSR